VCVSSREYPKQYENLSRQQHINGKIKKHTTKVNTERSEGLCGTEKRFSSVFSPRPVPKFRRFYNVTGEVLGFLVSCI
jgi:hypothetical protein